LKLPTIQKRGEYDAELGLRLCKGYKRVTIVLGLWWYNVRWEIR